VRLFVFIMVSSLVSIRYRYFLCSLFGKILTETFAEKPQEQRKAGTTTVVSLGFVLFS
jgi:hypothetical protein